MRETEWVEFVADAVRGGIAGSDQSLKIETQPKLPYGYEIRAYRQEREPESEAIEFATDFIVVENLDGGVEAPRGGRS